MKKVIRILLIFSILYISSCDFLRKVAGRPTEAEIEARAVYIEERRQEIQDSVFASWKAQREAEVQDSILIAQTAHRLDSMGVKLSAVFRFGQPQEQLKYRYNLIIGVFRTKSIVDSECKAASDSGFQPFLIPFNGGINALCLCGSDSLGVVADTYVAGRKAKICPRDAWVYVNGTSNTVLQ